MKSLKFLLIGLLSGCGANHYAMDPELQPYGLEYQQDAAAHGYNIVPTAMELSDDPQRIPSGLSGVCYRYSDGTTLIVLSHANFEGLENDTWKKALIWHEQGHCVFGLVHQPSGIMRATIELPLITSQSFDDYWALVKSTR
jgi:hypothetical protein